MDQGTITAKFDLGFADLTSHTMMRNEWSQQYLSIDDSTAGVQPGAVFGVNFLQVVFDNIDHTETQEFLLNSKPGGNLSWVLGAFYMNQIAGQNYFSLVLTPSGFGPNTNVYPANSLITPLTYLYDYTSHINIVSYAGFADATYKPINHLYLTVGGRYSYEVDYGSGNSTSFVDDINQRVKSTWPDFSPRAVIRWEFDPSNSVYASYTKGFKAGNSDVNDRGATGIIPPPPALPHVVLPEHIKAYEVGYKFQHGGSRADLSAFYYDYKNLQVSSYHGTISETDNAADSEIWGVEFDGSQRFLDHFTLSGGVAYTKAFYLNFPGAPRNDFNGTASAIGAVPSGSVGDILCTLNPNTAPCSGGEYNAKNNALERSPAWTGNVALDYATPLAGGKLDLNGNVYYTSKFYFDPANQFAQPAYTLVNLEGSWTDPSGHWTFTAFGQNVGDTHFMTQVLPNSVGVGVSWGMPAYYGVGVAYKY